MLRRKKKAATCSEFANACGIGYISRQKYMRIKLELEPAEESNWMMLEGQKREDHVCELYYRLMHAFHHPVQLEVHDFIDYYKDSRLGGSPDRIVRDNTGERWLLECKTAYADAMRDCVPPAHSLQMLGLCVFYNLPYAHYICSNYDKGIFIAQVSWTPNFWQDHIYPRLRQFADWWTTKTMPPTMKSADKEELLQLIQQHTIVTEVPAISRVMRARGLQ